MDVVSEKELVQNLIARDSRAYEVLLDRYEIPLYRFFYYSHRDHQTAQDQCGETFFRFVKAVGKNGTGRIRSLKAYLFGIARNILLETFQKTGPSRETVLLDQKPCSGPSVFRQVSSQDELEWVCRIIGQFNETEKQILLLRFMENATYEEIADIMGMPLNTVKSHIHRGRQKICEMALQKDPSDQEVEK